MECPRNYSCAVDVLSGPASKLSIQGESGHVYFVLIESQRVQHVDAEGSYGSVSRFCSFA
jgi:hypothetical protein